MKDGWTTREIANYYGISVKTVRKAIYRMGLYRCKPKEKNEEHLPIWNPENEVKHIGFSINNGKITITKMSKL